MSIGPKPLHQNFMQHLRGMVTTTPTLQSAFSISGQISSTPSALALWRFLSMVVPSFSRIDGLQNIRFLVLPPEEKECPLCWVSQNAPSIAKWGNFPTGWSTCDNTGNTGLTRGRSQVFSRLAYECHAVSMSLSLFELAAIAWTMGSILFLMKNTTTNQYNNKCA